MVNFFASNRYQFTCDTPGVHGALIFASGIACHELERRKLNKNPYMARRLLDPQLYLSTLDVTKAQRTCAKLASYGWFGSMTSTFDSGKQRQAEWRRTAADEVLSGWTSELPTGPSEIEDRARICVELQERIGCEAIILPSPLRTASGHDYERELAWLDIGLEVSRGVCGLPRIATVAISDTVLRGIDPWASSELDVLIDQVSARNPEGVYLVIEQASHDQHYESNPQVVGALVRLVRDLREAGVAQVMVPMAGVAGILAVAVGAELWSTGWYRSQRRIRLPDFEDADEPRFAVPTYYSHKLAGEIHLKTDLDTIKDAGSLGLIADHTSASTGLLQALEKDQYVANVPDWEPRRGNVQAARAHYAEALLRETLTLTPLSLDQRLEASKRWLDRAVSAAQRISALGEFNTRTTLSHQRAWRNVLELASSR